MAQNISLGIFGTFGNPNGFTQTIAGQIKGIKKYDLNPTAIQLFDSTQAMYALRKEVVGKEGIFSFVKYSYATEQGSTRGGTFVGASVINANGIADISSVVSVLNTLHQNLIKNPNNVKDGIIIVKHSNEFKIEDPSVDNLKISPEAISDIDFSERSKNLVVFTSLGNIQQSLGKAVDLLNDYDTIYFTGDGEVAKYVQKKGLYELIQEAGEVKQFTQKLQALDAAKVEQQKALVEKLLNNISVVKTDKESLQKMHLDSITKNKEIHQKNAEKIAEAEGNLVKYGSSFDQQIIRLQQLQQKLNGTHLKQADRKQFEKDIAQIQGSFDAEKRAFAEPSRLDSFSEVRRPSTTQSHRTIIWEEDYPNNNSRQKSSKAFSSKEIFIMLGILLFIGLLGAGGWFFFRGSNTNLKTDDNFIEGSTSLATHDTDHLNSQQIDLTPQPTGMLSFDETQKTIKKQFPLNELPMNIDSVVGKIIKANPTDVGKIYNGKEKEYGDYLIQQNPNNFDTDRKLTKSENLQIPIYKEALRGELKENNDLRSTVSADLSIGSEQTHNTTHHEANSPPSNVSDIKRK